MVQIPMYQPYELFLPCLQGEEDSDHYKEQFLSEKKHINKFKTESSSGLYVVTW